MKVSSFCSTWTGDGSNQSLTSPGDVLVTLLDGGAGSDSVTVTSGTCTFNLGTLSLGSGGYVTGGSSVFKGNGSNASKITWTSGTNTLLITLGTKTGTGTTATVAAGSIATYTPSTSQQDVAGNAISGSFPTANVKQF
jgi:hypothetical protein